MDYLSMLRQVLIYIVPAMAGIILHEVAHGWMANRLGDPTAKLAGRLTLNPLPHIDPMGLLIFVVTSLSGPFVFGWAKPVPIDTRYFTKGRRDLMLTALAGPTTNFLLAIFFAVLLWVLLNFVPTSFWLENKNLIVILQSCKAGVYINLSLAWLNLLPIPPLDGSKILLYFLPRSLAINYLRLEKYGFLILLILLFTNLISKILTPLVIDCADLLLAYLKVN